MEVIILTAVVVVAAVWYGLFSAVGVAADMGTRELRDLERKQKLRIVDTHANGSEVSDASISKAAKRIKSIDSLDI